MSESVLNTPLNQPNFFFLWLVTKGLNDFDIAVWENNPKAGIKISSYYVQPKGSKRGDFHFLLPFSNNDQVSLHKK